MVKRKKSFRDSVMPSFGINQEGFILCKEHSKFEKLKLNTHDFFLNFLTFKNLTCKSCQNYINDKCYFPQSELIKLLDELNIFHNPFRCQFCGRKIRNLFSILHHFMKEQVSNQGEAMICYRCQKILLMDNPKKGFIDSAKLTAMYSIINFLGILGVLIYFPLFSLLPMMFDSFLISIVILFVMSYFFIHYGRFSIKYYKIATHFEMNFSEFKLE
ncbi:MAG: hypothetical protein GF311_18635 [Candidatus Lokiarchaeota archaeon]|nr:hypothetical protein [Candidatus Lokiarchaeota archaeon]